MNPETIATGTHQDQEWRLLRVEDSDVESPRAACNLWTLVMSHRRRTLGDEQMDPEQFQESMADQGLNEQNCLMQPIYMYEHGQVAFSLKQTGQFADRWDAGQVGMAYLPVKRLIEELGVDTPETRAQALSHLNDELTIYAAYINGEGYGFIYEERPQGSDDDDDDKGWDQKDSCFGFLGENMSTNGMRDYLPAHVQTALFPPEPESTPSEATPSPRRRMPGR